MEKIETTPAQSTREYLREMVEAARQMSWVFREFSTKRTRRLSLVIIGLTVMMHGMGYMTAPFAGRMADAVPRHDWLALRSNLIMAVVATTVSFMANLAGQLLRTRLNAVQEVEVHEKIAKRFFEKSLGMHQRESSELSVGNIQHADDSIKNVLTGVSLELVSSGSQVIMAMILVAFVSKWAALALGVTLVAYLASSMLFNQRMLLLGGRSDELRRYADRYRIDRFNNVERCLNNGQEEAEVLALRQKYETYVSAFVSWWDKMDPLFSLRGYSLQLVSLGVVLIGMAEVWHGHGTVGTVLIPLIAWTNYFIDGLSSVSWLERSLHRELPSILSMRRAIYVPSDIVDGRLEMTDTSEAPIVAFENLSFAQGERQVLRRLSFSIGRGERVAIIGPSGAGKTTLEKLLLRYYDPQEGRILVDGHDLRDWRRRDWIGRLGHIAQKPQVLDDTVRANLVFGLSAAERAAMKDEELIAVLKKIKFDVSRLKDGLETLVGIGGVTLSGGEAQRLLIAAAVIRGPKLMVIDEATSALDSETESVVQEWLEESLGTDIGVLAIAHRLSTLKNFDKYIVLRSLQGLDDDEPQIEAMASSLRELYDISPTMRQMADKQEMTFPSVSARVLVASSAA